MATNKKRNMRHILFHGELSDAPGRNEFWDDYLRYLGNSRWELTTEGTDFTGVSAAAPVQESMSTRALVNWVLERDAELKENLSENDGRLDESDDEPPRQLGLFGVRLREIATGVRAPYCVSCLDGWLAGTWPAKKRQPAVYILDIKGVTRRGVWIRIYHNVYDVDTNLGSAFLYPPKTDRSATLILKADGSMSSGRTVKVSKVLMAKIESMKPDFDAHCDKFALRDRLGFKSH